MDQALIDLLEAKPFAYITVKEICEKAGVNRSAFYLHYETIGIFWRKHWNITTGSFWRCFPLYRIGLFRTSITHR